LVPPGTKVHFRSRSTSATRIPGIRVSEHLPRLAARMDRVALLRSVHHDAAPIHETGHQLMQTGRLSRGGVEHPHYGAVLSHLRGVRGAGSNHVGGPPRTAMDVVNVGRLAAFPAGTEVTPKSLRAARLINGRQVKVLGGGALSHALVVKAHAFSKSANERIDAAGGRVEVIVA